MIGTLIDPRVETVRLDQVLAYLARHGWKAVPYPRPQLLVFEGSNDDDRKPITLTVPSSERMKDFREGVVFLIRSLSFIENRPAQDVLSDILATAVTTPEEVNGAPPPKTTKPRTRRWPRSQS